MHESHKAIAILFHGGCPDGFSGAYAAWKKFGDSADYIPVSHGDPAPEHLEGKELYLIDFCYEKETMEELARTAKSVTVLDHHEGVKSVATLYPGVFDTSRSGATIAWSYFHPDTPVPTLLRYVEDGDLYRLTLPDSREVRAYVYAGIESFSSFEPAHLAKWDAFLAELEDPARRAAIVEKGKAFLEYHDHIVAHGVHNARLVTFEGYECYLTGATNEFKSDIGNRLAIVKPPLALIISAKATGLGVSLRSTGGVNVAEIAQKYGGNGHPAAAGFQLKYGDPIPWKLVEKKDETPGD